MTHKLFAIFAIVIGIILLTPFALDIFVLDIVYRHITTIPILKIISGILGQALIIFGIVKLIAMRFNGTISSTESDVSRIRYAVETEARRKHD